METIATKQAREYLYKFPYHPKLTVAKLLYKDHPKLYRSIEHARSTIRVITGTHGKKNKIQIKDKSQITEITNERNVWNFFKSFEPEKPVRFELPKSIKRVGLIGDIHFGYHDTEAIRGALEFFKLREVDCIFLNGDILDFYALSFHEKDPRKRNVGDELELCRQFLDLLNEMFPKAVKYFIPGNHENRLQRYLMLKAPELLGVNEFKLEVLLKLGEKKINYIPHGSDVYFGKLLVEHGDKMRGSGGVNPARSALLKFKRPVLINHFHRTTSANNSVYDDSPMMAWSVGCLCQLKADYLPVNEWNHGCTVIDMIGDEYRVHNKIIINGEVY